MRHSFLCEKIHPRRYRWLLPLMICLTATMTTATQALGDNVRNPRWAKKIENKHTENLHQVTPFLFRDEQPTAGAMKEYERRGIKTIINLRATSDDEDIAKKTRLTLIRIPIITWNLSQTRLATALAYIHHAEKPLLIHCMHGADRTGLVIALYRILDEGWTKEEALEEMTQGGYGYHSIWTNIISFVEDLDVESLRKERDTILSRLGGTP